MYCLKKFDGFPLRGSSTDPKHSINRVEFTNPEPFISEGLVDAPGGKQQALRSVPLPQNMSINNRKA
jgi:hypothetical protein